MEWMAALRENQWYGLPRGDRKLVERVGFVSGDRGFGLNGLYYLQRRAVLVSRY
jgi:hypothetical protein